MITQTIGPLLYRGAQFLRSAANVLRPRNDTDRIIQGGQTDDSCSSLITTGPVKITGAAGTVGGLILTETGNQFDCTLLTSASGTASNLGLSMKNNRFVISYVCGANGTMRHLSIQLDGLSCTWTAGATIP